MDYKTMRDVVESNIELIRGRTSPTGRGTHDQVCDADAISFAVFCSALAIIEAIEAKND